MSGGAAEHSSGDRPETTVTGSDRLNQPPPSSRQNNVHDLVDGNPHHVVAYRLSIPLFGQRYYLALFSGHDRRRPDRLEAEAQRKPWSHTIVGLLAVIGGISTAVMCTLAVAYLTKTMLGIDLFDDHFFLHQVFFG